MTELLEDISELTKVCDTTLKKFIPTINYCIGHAVHESECKQEDITIVDIGFGELHIKHDSSTLKYKFIPSKELESILVQTILSKRSPIMTKLELDLQEKIDRTYKELL